MGMAKVCTFCASTILRCLETGTTLTPIVLSERDASKPAQQYEDAEEEEPVRFF